jgi:hypothetical protein
MGSLTCRYWLRARRSGGCRVARLGLLPRRSWEPRDLPDGSLRSRLAVILAVALRELGRECIAARDVMPSLGKIWYR